VQYKVKIVLALLDIFLPLLSVKEKTNGHGRFYKGWYLKVSSKTTLMKQNNGKPTETGP
jgi:hypothetical protein